MAATMTIVNYSTTILFLRTERSLSCFTTIHATTPSLIYRIAVVIVQFPAVFSLDSSPLLLDYAKYTTNAPGYWIRHRSRLYNTSLGNDYAPRRHHLFLVALPDCLFCLYATL